MRAVRAVRGVRVEALTESIDVMPTILDFMGQTPPLQCDGASLLPFILHRGNMSSSSSSSSSPTCQPSHEGQPLLSEAWADAPLTPRGWRTGVHYEFDYADYSGGRLQLGSRATPSNCESLGRTVVAVYRTHSYKLVHFSDPIFPPLLFDMVADPGETINLATCPEHGTTLGGLVRQLLSLRMRKSGGRGLSERKVGAHL